MNFRIMIFALIAFFAGNLSFADELTLTQSQPVEISSGAVVDELPDTNYSFLLAAPGEKVTLNQGCCRICTTGKACGNSCISQNKTCHVGRGCACDG